MRAEGPELAHDRLMTAAARREFDCVLVWKLDRFGRSVLHLSQQLATLTSYGVRIPEVVSGETRSITWSEVEALANILPVS